MYYFLLQDKVTDEEFAQALNNYVSAGKRSVSPVFDDSWGDRLRYFFSNSRNPTLSITGSCSRSVTPVNETYANQSWGDWFKDFFSNSRYVRPSSATESSTRSNVVDTEVADQIEKMILESSRGGASSKTPRAQPIDERRVSTHSARNAPRNAPQSARAARPIHSSATKGYSTHKMSGTKNEAFKPAPNNLGGYSTRAPTAHSSNQMDLFDTDPTPSTTKRKFYDPYETETYYRGTQEPFQLDLFNQYFPNSIVTINLNKGTGLQYRGVRKPHIYEDASKILGDGAFSIAFVQEIGAPTYPSWKLKLERYAGYESNGGEAGLMWDPSFINKIKTVCKIPLINA